jgi:hypothetical protein
VSATARVAPEKAVFRPALPFALHAGLQPEKRMTTYWEKLRDPRWQRKRLEVMEAAGWVCEECGAKDKTLNVHHKRYLKGRSPWEYEMQDLACLCEVCHEQVTHTRSRIDLVLARLAGGDQEVALGLLAAYLSSGQSIAQVGATVHVNSYEVALGISYFLRCEPEEILDELDANNRIDCQLFVEKKKYRK